MTGQGWGTHRIALVLYPFGAGAVAINLFLAGLGGPWIGLPVMPPDWALAGGIVLGIPASLAFSRHIRSLMDRAEIGTEDVQ